MPRPIMHLTKPPGNPPPLWLATFFLGVVVGFAALAVIVTLKA